MNTDNRISIKPELPKRMNWDRVLFRINRCNGRISEKIKDSDIKDFKIDKDYIISILKKIEKTTGRFLLLRIYIILIIVYIILILISLALCLTYFLAIPNLTLAYLFTIITIILSLLFILLVSVLKRKIYRRIKKKVKNLFSIINDEFFIDKAQYIMLTGTLSHVGIYRIPKDVGIKIKIQQHTSLPTYCKNIITNDF